jgi:hypothetical protein
MINIQNNDIDTEKFDPQKPYMFAGWQRIVIAIEDRFKPFIPLVLPKLLQLAKTSHLSSNGENVKTSDSEDTEVAVQTLAVLIDTLGVDLFEYVNEIFIVLQLIIESTFNDETRIEAVKCLPGLLKIYKKAKQDLSTFGRHVNQTIWNYIEKETDPHNLSEYAYIVQRVMNNMGPILNDDEINAIYNKCYDNLKKSIERKLKIAEKFDKDEENPEDIEKVIDNDRQLEDELSLELANIIGVIFKVYKQRSINIFEHVYVNLISSALQQENQKMKHFALFLIDDSTEHIGEFIPKPILLIFMQTVTSFALHDNLEIRQAALFGIGIVACALKEDFRPILSQTMTLLSRACQIPKKNDDYPKFYSTVKENAVASFGKILQAFGDNCSVDELRIYRPFWIEHLPIEHDHKEAIAQHNYFLSLVIEKSVDIEITSPIVLKNIIRILTRIYNKEKLCNKNMRGLIIEIVKLFRNRADLNEVVKTLTLDPHETHFLNIA